MLKAYCDSDVFQKVILISPTAAYDAKYKMLPLTDVYEDYSDELLNDIMEEQKTDKALDQVPTVFQKPSTWSKDVSESRISHDMNRQMADKEQQLQAMEAEWVRERTRLNRTVERLEREGKVSQEREQVQQNQGRREAQRAQEELAAAEGVIATKVGAKSQLRASARTLATYPNLNL